MRVQGYDHRNGGYDTPYGYVANGTLAMLDAGIIRMADLTEGKQMAVRWVAAKLESGDWRYTRRSPPEWVG